MITNEQGFIDSEDFKDMLMEMGRHWTTEQAEALVSEADKNGTFDQGAFVRKLYGGKGKKGGKKGKKGKKGKNKKKK